MKVCLLTLFLFALAFPISLKANIQQECRQLTTQTIVDCTHAQTICNSLDKCQKRRTKCNQDIKTPKGCNDLNQCMKDNFGGSASRVKRGPCQYKWKSYSCVNDTIFEKVASCPGSNAYSAPFTDYGFNCEGNKGYFNKVSQKCKETYKRYQAICAQVKQVVDLEKNMPEAFKCEFLKVEVSPLSEQSSVDTDKKVHSGRHNTPGNAPNGNLGVPMGLPDASSNR